MDMTFLHCPLSRATVLVFHRRLPGVSLDAGKPPQAKLSSSPDAHNLCMSSVLAGLDQFFPHAPPPLFDTTNHPIRHFFMHRSSLLITHLPLYNSRHYFYLPHPFVSTHLLSLFLLSKSVSRVMSRTPEWKKIVEMTFGGRVFCKCCQPQIHWYDIPKCR